MKQIVDRIIHMIKTKDCRHICLFCKYYDLCKLETTGEKEE